MDRPVHRAAPHTLEEAMDKHVEREFDNRTTSRRLARLLSPGWAPDDETEVP